MDFTVFLLLGAFTSSVLTKDFVIRVSVWRRTEGESGRWTPCHHVTASCGRRHAHPSS